MSTQIDTSNLTKIGNMTSGGGLAAIIDGSPSTGYAQSLTGYAGVTLSAPTLIDRVELTSPDNGFDASGLTTTVTLRLRAKNGAAPLSAGDGQLLGEVTFTDQNSVRTITIESTDKITQFDHVWASLSTGVWCILSEFAVYAADEPVYPDPLSAGRHVFLKSCNDAVQLPKNAAEIPQFRIFFRLAEQRTILVDFHVDVKHVGEGSDASIAVGYGFRICKRSADSYELVRTLPFVGIVNASGGGNVSERNPQHYGNKAITTAIELSAGYHEISVVGTGHTDGSSTPGLLQMLVESGQGKNALRVIVEPSETIFH